MIIHMSLFLILNIVCLLEAAMYVEHICMHLSIMVCSVYSSINGYWLLVTSNNQLQLLFIWSYIQNLTSHHICSLILVLDPFSGSLSSVALLSISLSYPSTSCAGPYATSSSSSVWNWALQMSQGQMHLTVHSTASQPGMHNGFSSKEPKFSSILLDLFSASL